MYVLVRSNGCKLGRSTNKKSNVWVVVRIDYKQMHSVCAYWWQGCQMLYFKSKNINFGVFWKALEWKFLVYFMANCCILWAFVYILWPFGNFVIFGYIFPRFGMLYQEESGNPDHWLRCWENWPSKKILSDFFAKRLETVFIWSGIIFVTLPTETPKQSSVFFKLSQEYTWACTFVKFTCLKF
jgi:hypothetical protein